MHVDVVNTKIIKLVLTEQEAVLLKGYVQNCMFEHREDEPDEVTNLRALIFNNLKEAGL
jgi:hypothetical protein